MIEVTLESVVDLVTLTPEAFGIAQRMRVTGLNVGDTIQSARLVDDGLVLVVDGHERHLTISRALLCWSKEDPPTIDEQIRLLDDQSRELATIESISLAGYEYIENYRLGWRDVVHAREADARAEQLRELIRRHGPITDVRSGGWNDLELITAKGKTIEVKLAYADRKRPETAYLQAGPVSLHVEYL